MNDKSADQIAGGEGGRGEVKDRRRFLKKLAVCAVTVPVISVLPQMAAACTSGVGSDSKPDPKPTVPPCNVTCTNGGHAEFKEGRWVCVGEHKPVPTPTIPPCDITCRRGKKAVYRNGKWRCE